MEALGYLLLYFLKPKSTLFRKTAGSMHPDLLYERKVSVPIEVMCNDLPRREFTQSVEFTLYMKYVAGLGFDETPDYGHVRRIFYNLYNNRKGQGEEMVFCWFTPKTVSCNHEELGL